MASNLFLGGVGENQTKQPMYLASWCLGKKFSRCFGQGYAPSPFMDVINSEHLNAVVAI